MFDRTQLLREQQDWTDLMESAGWRLLTEAMRVTYFQGIQSLMTIDPADESAIAKTQGRVATITDIQSYPAQRIESLIEAAREASEEKRGEGQ